MINADDYGYSESVNKAIADCFERKLINRTTIMVNMPCAEEAARLAKEKGFFGSVGLHINLTEGKALAKECAASPLCDENGYFKGVFYKPFKARLYLKKSIRDAIYAETEAQMKKYLEMGFTLMHADSHNYTHMYFSVYVPVRKLLKKYGFTSVRISRNIPENDFSFAFKVYKTAFNFLIRHLKVNGKTVKTLDYFGSVQDFKTLDNPQKYRNDIEFMTHPDYTDGVLTDKTLPCPHPFVDEKWIKDNKLHLEDVSGKKKQILVTFIQTHVGGAMTALVNFLNALDTEKYDVDVIFYKDNGENERNGIKESINILPQGRKYANPKSIGNILAKVLSPRYVIGRVREKYVNKAENNRYKALQIASREGCKYDRKLTKEYDLAIAFEFSWPLYYMMHSVKAKKKICWFHLNYDRAGYCYKIDRKIFKKADALVFVSEECRRSFCDLHPECTDKTYFMPNLLTAEYIKNKGNEEISLPFEKSEAKLTFLTVARIDFNHKGLDRALDAFSSLKDEGLTDGVKWIVVGGGDELDEFKRRISKNGLENIIYPVGLKLNPIPYMRNADVFLLPSRFEGKPMVITEGFISGIVPAVTEYASAKEQIRDKVDGLIFENSYEGLYSGLKKIINNPKIIDELRQNVINTEYGNEKDICIFYNITDKIFG